ncbi:type II toxin-antitoxin system Phd/YefM family antitoxin [Kitasatospora sp. NPDC057223]|uniref:type II toxin-antitoxin system Phd/YefM family antitoxin n=1 Tax=Kitasatospora sp. NPDC057223 TaxID=3346055 RepID=UPI00362F0969
MDETLPITAARAKFGSLVRRVLHGRERITITDHGQLAAVLINPRELAALEDDLALAQYRERQNTPTTAVTPHDDVRTILGLERG